MIHHQQFRCLPQLGCVERIKDKLWLVPRTIYPYSFNQGCVIEVVRLISDHAHIGVVVSIVEGELYIRPDLRLPIDWRPSDCQRHQEKADVCDDTQVDFP